MEEPIESSEKSFEKSSEPLEWYMLLDGSHGFRGMRARKGEKILLTSREAEKLGSRVQRAQSKENQTTKTTPTKVDTNSVTARDWSSTQDMKATDVIDLINETDSKEELASLQEVEEKGQNRVGVLNAIKKRMGQIG